MSDSRPPLSNWKTIRDQLVQSDSTFFELEPEGALAMQLDHEEWLLEVTPDGRVICQTGMDMEDLMSVLSDGTPEDLGTDEIAKQAKYYIQPTVDKFKRVLLAEGFEQQTEMNDDFVAVTFHRIFDFSSFSELTKSIQWCKERIKP